MRVIGLEPEVVKDLPPCPFGHVGEVRTRGFRVIKGSAFARPMFRCVHRVCDRHCRECDRDRTLRDGSARAVSWDFEARLIAEALISVGKGMSYRKAAQEMRDSALRYETRNGVKVISKWGNSVHRHLDHFGALVLDKVEHQEWPEVLVVDALPLRQRTVVEGGPYSFEQSGSGAILVAVGYTDAAPVSRRRVRDDDGNLVARKPETRRSPHVWRMTLSGGHNRFAWHDFFASLTGTPRWIVADGDSAVRIAARWRWGDGPEAPVVFGGFQSTSQHGRW